MPEPPANILAFADRPWLIAIIAMVLIAAVALPAASADPPGAMVNPQTGLARMTGGFKVGLSLSQHQGVEDPRLPYTVDSEYRQGIAVGAFLQLPVTERFGLQQEVLYVQKGSRQAIGVEILDIPTTLDVVYDLDYLEIPLLLRYVWLRGRRLDAYSLGGFAFALKVKDHYRLRGLVVGEEDQAPVRADAAMDEVDIFDFAFVYGMGLEMPVWGKRLFLEYRFSLSLDRLPLPTYAYVPFGADEEILIENEPVPLRNQAHGILLGIRF